MTTANPGAFRIAVRKNPPFENAIRAQWKDFEAKHRSGLSLEAEAMDLHDLEQAVLHGEGMRDGTWDVAFVPTDWIYELQQRGRALDLAPRIAAKGPRDFPEGWSPSLLRLQDIDGAVLGVPYHDGPECLIYRRDLFDDPAEQAAFHREYGRALHPPATWSEFHETARFFQRPERGLYGTVFAAFPDGHNSVYDFLLQLWSRGGELTAPAEDVRFATPHAEAALAFYREILTDTAAIHPESERMDSVQSGAAFARGEVALMINWFGFATKAHTDGDSRVRGHVDIAPIPHDAGGSPLSLNVYWLLAIAQGSRNADIAWDFLCHVLTPEMDRQTTVFGGIGCRKSTWEDAEVNLQIPFYHSIEALHRHAREIPRRADWTDVAGIINRLVVAAIRETTPIAALLRQADKEFAETQGRH